MYVILPALSLTQSVHYKICIRLHREGNRDRNWEVQAGSPDKIFDKTCLYV